MKVSRWIVFLHTLLVVGAVLGQQAGSDSQTQSAQYWQTVEPSRCDGKIETSHDPRVGSLYRCLPASSSVTRTDVRPATIARPDNSLTSRLPGPSAASPQSAITPRGHPTVIRVCGKDFCATLTWNGDHYDAVKDGESQLWGTYTVREWSADSITLLCKVVRPAPNGQPIWLTITGAVSGGNSVKDGYLEWRAGNASGSGRFDAYWGSALNAASAGGRALSTSTSSSETNYDACHRFVPPALGETISGVPEPSNPSPSVQQTGPKGSCLEESKTKPVQLTECEADQCGREGASGTWILIGQGGFAHWQYDAVATLTVKRFDDGGVVIHRQDPEGSSSAGLTADYEGSITGNRIDGTVTWTWPGHWTTSPSGTWSAVIRDTPPTRAEAGALASSVLHVQRKDDDTALLEGLVVFFGGELIGEITGANRDPWSREKWNEKCTFRGNTKIPMSEECDSHRPVD